MTECLRIEICRSYLKDRFHYREGDESGSVKMGNVTEEQIIKEIRDAMAKLPPFEKVSDAGAKGGSADGQGEFIAFLPERGEKKRFNRTQKQPENVLVGTPANPAPEQPLTCRQEIMRHGQCKHGNAGNGRENCKPEKPQICAWCGERISETHKAEMCRPKSMNKYFAKPKATKKKDGD